jgi:hypothetical protein
LTEVKDPWIIDNFFTEKQYSRIMSGINSIPKNIWRLESLHNRYVFESDFFNRIGDTNIDRARKEFNSNTLLHTYSLLSFYNQDNSRLQAHKDNNACTYTFDICLYSKEPWPIIVEGEEYSLNNNQALCFYGEDQFHSRTEFKKGNEVLMLFMHFAEPNHIFFIDCGVF